MRNLKNSEKILLGILLFAVIGYIYFQYLLSPTLSGIKTAQTSINDHNRELAQIEVLKASNKKLEADLTDLKASAAEDSGAIPNNSETPQIQRDVKDIADKAKVSLMSIAFKTGIEFRTAQGSVGSANANASSSTSNTTDNNTVTTSSKTMDLPVTISISGDYDGIKNFVKGLETYKRISTISNFTITSDNQNASGGKLTSAIDVDFYYIDNGKNGTSSYDFNNGHYGNNEPYK